MMSLKFWKRKKKTDDVPAEDKGQAAEEQPKEEVAPVPADEAATDADNTTESDSGETAPKPSIVKRLVKAALLLVLLAVLLVVGFGVGVYMRVIDGNAAGEQLKKHDIPILGEYLAKIPLMPETPDEPKKDEPADNEATQPTATTEKKADSNEAKPEDKQKDRDKDKDKEEKSKPKSKTIKLTKEEIEKQTKEREAAEKKRVSKLARLYTNMKAKEAADALENLDNNMIIAILQRMEEGQAAKILAQFAPERTAQITRIMFVGVQQRVTVPSDLVEGSEESSGE